MKDYKPRELKASEFRIKFMVNRNNALPRTWRAILEAIDRIDRIRAECKYFQVMSIFSSPKISDAMEDLEQQTRAQTKMAKLFCLGELR